VVVVVTPVPVVGELPRNDERQDGVRGAVSGEHRHGPVLLARFRRRDPADRRHRREDLRPHAGQLRGHHRPVRQARCVDACQVDAAASAHHLEHLVEVLEIGIVRTLCGVPSDGISGAVGEDRDEPLRPAVVAEPRVHCVDVSPLQQTVEVDHQRQWLLVLFGCGQQEVPVQFTDLQVHPLRGQLRRLAAFATGGGPRARRTRCGLLSGRGRDRTLDRLARAVTAPREQDQRPRCECSPPPVRLHRRSFPHLARFRA
jgi:hypothetical protein